MDIKKWLIIKLGNNQTHFSICLSCIYIGIVLSLLESNHSWGQISYGCLERLFIVILLISHFLKWLKYLFFSILILNILFRVIYYLITIKSYFKFFYLKKYYFNFKSNYFKYFHLKTNFYSNTLKIISPNHSFQI